MVKVNYAYPKGKGVLRSMYKFLLIGFVLSFGLNVYFFFVHNSDEADNSYLHERIEQVLSEKKLQEKEIERWADSAATLRKEMNEIKIPPTPIFHEVKIDRNIRLDSLSRVLAKFYNTDSI